jgi:leucyl aminopeptidase (aminopeptidase T)
MPTDPSIEAGAKQIVRRCLGMEPGQDLVIFVDETTVEPGVAIAEAAEALQVPHTVILVPVSVQHRVPYQSELSLLVQGAARQARAILTCLNATPECLPFRDWLLETHWSARTRLGHMPGATLDGLKLADIDVDQLVADCRAVEFAMACGHTLELLTTAPDGTPHQLTADIGGWERLPVASDGIIIDGAWGNIPSGETYIAPLEGTADGSVVIDGSVPGRVIEPEDAITVHVVEGHARRIEPAGSPTVRWLEESQIRVAKARRDRNWSNVAEIGIGLNRAVRRLTGNMLLDEKAAGTAHIALGTNTFMGGHVEASIHCDLVMRMPTVIIDGKTILERGRLRFVESEWRESYASVPLEQSPLRTASQVARSGVQASASTDRRLQRILRPEPGRVSACFVGDDETARLAHRLYDLIPNEGGWLPVDDLALVADLSLELVRRTLHVMWTYYLIRFR